MTNVIEELIRDAEQEPETSTENIRGLNEIKIQHEQMLQQFQVKVLRIQILLSMNARSSLGTSSEH